MSPVRSRRNNPARTSKYDLAHESSDERMTVGPKDDEQRVTIITGTAGYDGDYSYDLAHDIPGR